MQNRIVTIVCAGLLLFSLGCGGKQPDRAREVAAEDVSAVRKNIKKQIDDKELRAHLLLLVDEGGIIFAHMRRHYLELQDELESNPNMSKEELEPKYLAFAEKRRKGFDQLIVLQMEMRRLLTAEQWESIFAFPEEDKEKEE